MTVAWQESSASAAPMPLEGVLERSAIGFEAGVLERLVVREPANVDYLAALGQAYSRLGRPADCLVIDRQLVDHRPAEPVFRYNLACSLCLTGDLDGACRELLAAIDHGYADMPHLEQDIDLAALRDDARFGLVRDHLRAALRQA